MGQFDSLWEEFFSMQREMQKFVEHIAGKRPSFAPFAEEPWVPACDVFETDVAFFVVVELAGVDPKEVEIFIQGRKLVVRGGASGNPLSAEAGLLSHGNPFRPFLPGNRV